MTRYAQRCAERGTDADADAIASWNRVGALLAEVERLLAEARRLLAECRRDLRDAWRVLGGGR